MTGGTGEIEAAPAPSWGLRLSASQGRLPLGVVFGTIGALGAVAVGLLGLDRLPFPVCLLKAATGLPCPTCGSTRALARLLHFDLPGALAMNPLATAGLIVLAAWALVDLGLLARGRALDLEIGRPLSLWVRIAALGAVLANWAYLLAAGR
jgi:hypothetical protein